MTQAEPGVTTRSTEMRSRLYAAAAELFVEQGYENTTMADIAARAGASRRTAFNHFPSKSDIPMLWTRQMADVAVGTALQAGSPDGVDQIRSYFRLLSDMVESTADLSRQMMVGWVAATGPIRYESQLLADIAPLLSSEQGHGRIAVDVDADTAARTLSDIFMGAVLRWVHRGDPGPSLADAVEAGTDLVLAALRSDAPEEQTG